MPTETLDDTTFNLIVRQKNLAKALCGAATPEKLRAALDAYAPGTTVEQALDILDTNYAPHLNTFELIQALYDKGWTDRD